METSQAKQKSRTLEIAAQMVPGKPFVTVLRVRGFVDGSNYETLIARAAEAYQAGVRKIILDLQDCPFMSSGGLIALRRIVDLLQGKAPGDSEGWSAIRGLRGETARDQQQNLLLLNPTPRVVQVLEMAGFKDDMPIFADLNTAMGSLPENG